MLRFIITVLVGTVFHAVACILVPPFEFGLTRSTCFFWALRSGLVIFPIVFAILLLPLRAALRHFLPQSTGQTHTLVAALVLYVVPATRTLVRQLSGAPAEPFEHGYLCQWVFWALLSIVVAFAFFWPFGAQRPGVR